jgi:hypothetical protein
MTEQTGKSENLFKLHEEGIVFSPVLKMGRWVEMS